MIAAHAPEIGLALVVPLLIAHAVLSHGVWFAAIWIGLASAFGLAREAWTAAATGLVRYGDAWAWVGDVPLYVGPGWCAGIYLGALFAKGFVERSRLRGRIAPFVAAHGLFTAVVALPVEAVAAPAGWWRFDLETRVRVFETPLLALVGWALGGALFGLAYRLASRRTSHDPAKFRLLLVALPFLVAAHVGAVALLAPAFVAGP